MAAKSNARRMTVASNSPEYAPSAMRMAIFAPAFRDRISLVDADCSKN